MRIGIDLGGTKIEAIALDASGATLLRHRIPTPAGDYAATLAAIAGLVAFVETHAGRRGSVGVATPGALSLRTGLIKNAHSTVLNGKALDRDLTARLGRPVLLDGAFYYQQAQVVDFA
jgi:fructokinase